MPETDLILEVLDIRNGKFGFAAICPEREKAEFYIVPFADIRVNIEGETQVVKVNANCDCCGWLHKFILWKNW